MRRLWRSLVITAAMLIGSGLGCDGGGDATPAPGADSTPHADLPTPLDTGHDAGGASDSVDVAPELPPFQCREEIAARIVVDNRDETFDLGPYLMVPTDTEITIMWRTLHEDDGAVLYGLGDETNLEVLEEGTRTVHAVRLTGLSPDTRYAYRVRSGDRTSDLHHFYTAPPFGGSFRFAGWGDNQGSPIFPDTIAALIEEEPHLLLGFGDHVGDGRIDAQWKDQLFDPGRALFHEVPFFAAFGNHGKNGKLYYDLMGFQDLAVSPESESVYSFTYGNAFFLVYDTNGIYFPLGDVDSPWSEFIKEQVASEAAQNATWRFAYAHEPAANPEISNSPDCGGVYLKTNEAFMMPLLNEYGFHAYFSGHSHLYERTMVGDLLHLISGGGGGGLEYCEDAPDMDKATTIVRHHFLRGLVGCDSVRIEAVDYLEGEVIDWVVLGPEPGTILDSATMGTR